MGNFYVNHTVCGQELPAVIQYLSGSEAYVSQVNGGCIVVFDEKSETEFTPAIDKLGIALSQRPGARVLSIAIHDDDVMMYWLFRQGRIVDTYNSRPDYGEVVETPMPPEGGESSGLCSAFECGNAEEVERVLRSHGSDGFVCEYERHMALILALNLQRQAVSTGFGYLQAGEFPEGFTATDFVLVPR